ncbi:MAG TPA: hypothetical protein VG798_01740 [Rhizomicrobium sp.]|nr:hypothetical protein [Rhizomicrobium sp.]
MGARASIFCVIGALASAAPAHAGAPLAPEKPAGIAKAQAVAGSTLLYAGAFGAVAGSAMLAASGGGNHGLLSGTITTGSAGGTTGAVSGGGSGGGNSGGSQNGSSGGGSGASGTGAGNTNSGGFLNFGAAGDDFFGSVSWLALPSGTPFFDTGTDILMIDGSGHVVSSTSTH